MRAEVVPRDDFLLIRQLQPPSSASFRSRTTATKVYIDLMVLSRSWEFHGSVSSAVGGVEGCVCCTEECTEIWARNKLSLDCPDVHFKTREFLQEF